MFKKKKNSKSTYLTLDFLLENHADIYLLTTDESVSTLSHIYYLKIPCMFSLVISLNGFAVQGMCFLFSAYLA